MTEGWKFSLQVHGDESTKNEFRSLFIGGILPRRLRDQISEDEINDRELFYNLGALLLEVDEPLPWWNFEEELAEVSSWFPALSIKITIESECEMLFLDGKLISTQGAFLQAR